MPTKRDLPHVRAESLPELLAGEYHCEWAAWVKARHPDRIAPPSSSDDADPEHGTLPDQQKAGWAERGYAVATDADNAFILRGRNAVLTGAPELIVARGTTTPLSSASPPGSHVVHTAPWSDPNVCPPQGARPIPRHGAARRAGVRGPYGTGPERGVHQGLIRNLGALIKRVVADEPTTRVPSAHECGSCAIAAAECPVRVDVQLDDEPQDPVQEPTSPVALPRSVSLPDRPPIIIPNARPTNSRRHALIQ